MYIAFTDPSKPTVNRFMRIARVPFIALVIYCSALVMNWTLQTIATFILFTKASPADRFIVRNGLGCWHISDVLNYVTKGTVPETKMKIDDELITAWIYPCLLFMPLLLSAFKQYLKTCYSYDKLKKHEGGSELFSAGNTHQQ